MDVSDQGKGHTYVVEGRKHISSYYCAVLTLRRRAVPEKHWMLLPSTMRMVGWEIRECL